MESLAVTSTTFAKSPHKEQVLRDVDTTIAQNTSAIKQSTINHSTI
ncbi:MAG: hypothetical protein RL660_140 [Bacteroidota bacterium]|jgi:hypothetical protein